MMIIDRIHVKCNRFSNHYGIWIMMSNYSAGTNEIPIINDPFKGLLLILF